MSCSGCIHQRGAALNGSFTGVASTINFLAGTIKITALAEATSYSIAKRQCRRPKEEPAMFKTLTGIVLLAATTALASPSFAAMQFTAVPVASGRFVLDMAGEISPGDTAAAANFVKQHMITAPGDRLIGYQLYSPGGQVLEAELMAAAIKKSNLPTEVDTLCASSCFLPFAAGSVKIVMTSAKIGVHSISDASGIETVRTAAATTMMARDYADLGVPTAIIGKMVATFPGQVTWLTADDLRSMNVQFVTPPPAAAPATTTVPAKDAFWPLCPGEDASQLPWNQRMPWDSPYSPWCPPTAPKQPTAGQMLGAGGYGGVAAPPGATAPITPVESTPAALPPVRAAETGDTTAQLNRAELARIQQGNTGMPAPQPAMPMAPAATAALTERGQVGPPPPLSSSAPATVPEAPAAAPDSAAYKTGLADGRAYRAWAESLVGDYKAGSDYWASVRSVPSKAKLGCNASGVTADFVAGCHEAASRLAVFDHHRLSDPDYKAGWTAAFA